MHGGSSARFPTKPTEKLKIEKMYAIKQIKICAEYRDMLPRPRLDLSGTPGLRPIGLSPGSWQTSLGLGSMSRYSAQILICIIRISWQLVQCIWHSYCEFFLYMLCAILSNKHFSSSSSTSAIHICLVKLNLVVVTQLQTSSSEDYEARGV